MKNSDCFRTLGLDYGRVRIGVAVSDPCGMIAQPDGYIENRSPKRAVEEIRTLCVRRQVGAIVMGLPRHMTGEESEMSAEIRVFAERLREALALPVTLWDERMTSQAAERALLEGDVSRRHRKEKIDAVAAAIMLQSYLDRQAASAETGLE